MDLLPPECWAVVIEHLEPLSVGPFIQTCRLFRDLWKDPILKAKYAFLIGHWNASQHTQTYCWRFGGLMNHGLLQVLNGEVPIIQSFHYHGQQHGPRIFRDHNGTIVHATEMCRGKLSGWSIRSTCTGGPPSQVYHYVHGFLHGWTHVYGGDGLNVCRRTFYHPNPTRTLHIEYEPVTGLCRRVHSNCETLDPDDAYERGIVTLDDVQWNLLPLDHRHARMEQSSVSLLSACTGCAERFDLARKSLDVLAATAPETVAKPARLYGSSGRVCCLMQVV